MHAESPSIVAVSEEDFVQPAVQETIRSCAAAEQQIIFEACEKAAPADDYCPSKGYRRYGGPAMEDMLATVPLIDAHYLVRLAKLGGILPRGQDVPATALITRASAWRLRRWSTQFSLPVLVLSYPWLDKDHPDRHGELLRRLAPVLEAMLDECQRGSLKKGGEERLHSLAPKAATVGVMLDFCSLPQWPRTEAEQARFEAGLHSMHLWYSHPFTHVLLVTTPLPDDPAGAAAAYTNRRPYEERGWCFFELHMSSLVKNADVLWDLRHFDGKSHSYDALRAQLRTGRRPPLSPSRLEQEMSTRVAAGTLSFSYASDIEPVFELYRRGFVQAFVGYRQLRSIKTGAGTSVFCGNLGWGAEEAAQLADAIRFIGEHCEMAGGAIELTLRGNCFPPESQELIMVAVEEIGGESGGKIFVTGIADTARSVYDDEMIMKILVSCEGKFKDHEYFKGLHAKFTKVASKHPQMVQPDDWKGAMIREILELLEAQSLTKILQDQEMLNDDRDGEIRWESPLGILDKASVWEIFDASEEEAPDDVRAFVECHHLLTARTEFSADGGPSQGSSST